MKWCQHKLKMYFILTIWDWLRGQPLISSTFSFAKQKQWGGKAKVNNEIKLSFPTPRQKKKKKQEKKRKKLKPRNLKIKTGKKNPEEKQKRHSNKMQRVLLTESSFLSKAQSYSNNTLVSSSCFHMPNHAKGEVRRRSLLILQPLQNNCWHEIFHNFLCRVRIQFQGIPESMSHSS